MTRKLLLLLPLTLAGCGLFGGSQTGGPGVMVDLAHNSATITGRVPISPGRDVTTYTITVFTVKSDGTPNEQLGTGSVDTTGHYSVTVTWDQEKLGQLLNGVIVQVSDGKNEMRAVLAEPVGDKAASTAPPVDDETTAESDVYVESKKQGTWTEHSTIAGLREAIDASFATSLKASSNRAEDLHAASVATHARMDARVKALLNASIGATAAQIEALEAAEAKAQTAYDVALDGADTQAKLDAAATAHDASLSTAYDAQGLSPDDVSKATRIALDASTHAGAQFSAALATAWKASTQLSLAAAVTRANESAFAALNAQSATTTSVATARATLLTSLKTSGDADAAWAAYNASVKGSLKSTNDGLTLGGGLAIDVVLGTLTVAKGVLTTALSAATSVDAVLAAYNTYYAAVGTATSANLTLKLLGASQLTATTQVVTELSLQ